MVGAKGKYRHTRVLTREQPGITRHLPAAHGLVRPRQPALQRHAQRVADGGADRDPAQAIYDVGAHGLPSNRPVSHAEISG